MIFPFALRHRMVSSPETSSMIPLDEKPEDTGSDPLPSNEAELPVIPVPLEESDERSDQPELPTDDDAAPPVIADDTNGPEPILSELRTLMLQLAKDFESKLKYDAAKQGQIDKLYNETQEYKQGILRKFQHSLIIAVIEQIDQAAKQIAFFTNAEFSETMFRKMLDSYQDITVSFQDMLTEKFSVQVYRCEPHTRFDPKRQRTLKTTPTRDVTLNKHVKASLRPGYETEECYVIRPELVEVYIFDETAEVSLIAKN
ncbi:MAG: hypothetical protein ACRC2T_17810 [Thermoguttaceae bacterium]